MSSKPFDKACVRAQFVTTLLTTSATVALLGVAGPARADCAPVISAYMKAEATKHYAIYEVDRVDATPKGEPFAVAVGDTMYVENVVQRSPVSFVKDGYVRRGSIASVEGDMLKADEKKGEKRCETIGDRKAGALSLVTYRIRTAAVGNDPYAIEMWVDKSTGLPFFHGMGSDNGGFRWAYGAAVVPPPAAQVH